MVSLELKVPPLLQCVTAVALLCLISELFPYFHIAIRYGRYLAIGVVVAGIAIAVSGVLAFRLHKTTVNPLKPERTAVVVRTGIYQVTRNPMYLGMVWILVGVAIGVANAVAFLVVIPMFMVYMTRFQIIPEERALALKFGADFLDYLHEVPRWL